MATGAFDGLMNPKRAKQRRLKTKVAGLGQDNASLMAELALVKGQLARSRSQVTKSKLALDYLGRAVEIDEENQADWSGASDEKYSRPRFSRCL